MITIKYFASLREKTGRDQDQLEYFDGMTIQNVWDQLEMSGLQVNDLLCAKNLEFTRWDTQISDGDEIAFFPPVTGG